jgi:glycine/D-amino acid oxidase-like deaminating enzyme
MAFDVAIIGAGIVGAACAWECVKASLKVVVIESGIPGGGATAAGMGHIVVMDDSPAQLALTLYSRTLWQELSAELPRSVDYDPCGTLWIAADEEEMREVQRKQVLYARAGVLCEVVDSKTLAMAEPNLRPGLAGALFVADDAVSYPPCAARYLLGRAREGGAQLVRGKAAAIEAGLVRLKDGTAVSAGSVVNATGTWAAGLTPGIPVNSRKGHLAITDRYPGFLRRPLVELGYLKSAHSLTADSVAFNAQPRLTGQILIGSSRQYGVEDSGIDAPILNRMLDRAGEYMPQIGSLLAVRTWTGFRAATPDKLPLIGGVPGKPGLLLATGHEGLGITTSLGTAKLIVSAILGVAPAIAAEPYLPARFPEARYDE